MEFSLLTQNGALNAGSEIWFLPDPGNSQWSCKIDWYLNFQIAKAENRTPRNFSDPLRNLIREQKLDIPEFQRLVDPPLMVSSAQFIENKATICIPFDKPAREWVTDISETSIKLNVSSIRVFLPKQVTFEEFQKMWPDPDLKIHCSVVTERLRRH